MNTKELVKEANELLRQGFDEVDSSWRQNATIISSTDFASGIQTYAKMATLSRDELESGKWKARVRTLGRQAAETFNSVLRKQTDQYGSELSGLQVVVNCLNGHEYPVVELGETEADGSVTLRGYHDFGIDVWRKDVACAGS